MALEQRNLKLLERHSVAVSQRLPVEAGYRTLNADGTVIGFVIAADQKLSSLNECDRILTVAVTDGALLIL